MTNRRRTTRGSSLTEACLVMAILSFGTLSYTSEEHAKLAAERDRDYQSQAEAIAEGQMTYINGLRYDDLAVNDDFEPVPWIQQPDCRRGEIPVIVEIDGVHSEREQVYAVAWHVVEATNGDLIRNVQLQVEWTDSRDNHRSHTIRGIRWR